MLRRLFVVSFCLVFLCQGVFAFPCRILLSLQTGDWEGVPNASMYDRIRMVTEGMTFARFVQSALGDLSSDSTAALGFLLNRHPVPLNTALRNTDHSLESFIRTIWRLAFSKGYSISDLTTSSLNTIEANILFNEVLWDQNLEIQGSKRPVIKINMSSGVSRVSKDSLGDLIHQTVWGIAIDGNKSYYVKRSDLTRVLRVTEEQLKESEDPMLSKSSLFQ